MLIESLKKIYISAHELKTGWEREILKGKRDKVQEVSSEECKFILQASPNAFQVVELHHITSVFLFVT